MQIRPFWYTLDPIFMCGITGIWTQRSLQPEEMAALKASVRCIASRGPDAEGTAFFGQAGLGHTRLAIIDTSVRSNQPMQDPSGRYHLVFNGEIYNHREIAAGLFTDYGVHFQTTSDTEVLLHALIHRGEEVLKSLNGFFAFALYDRVEHSLLCARDRFGIKPFYYSSGDFSFSFGSNLRAVMAYSMDHSIDHDALATYLQLSYVPDPISMVEGIHKLSPGQSVKVNAQGTSLKYWVDDRSPKEPPPEGNREDTFRSLLQESVSRRLLADVPVGTFLSGGFDSSVITLLAKSSGGDLPAFSIGFPDHPYFDESAHARKVAAHIGVRHEVFEVRERDIEEELNTVIDALDEPFADSSAVLVSILSQRTRREVKVALSGDGADELLGGYNKHRALLRSMELGLLNRALKASAPALGLLPTSRSHRLFNRLRKLKRYSGGLHLDFTARYMRWASFTERGQATALLLRPLPASGLHHRVMPHFDQLDPTNFNSVLLTDMGLVLPNDMLHKVDSMSMHRGLEVRVPFLDPDVVDFVRSLPASEKVDKRNGKKLLRQTFARDFPTDFFQRGKRGFEAPLRHWLMTVLRSEMDRLMDMETLQSQGIFNAGEVHKLIRKMKSASPGDTPHTLWAILVFQRWWERHFVHRV